MYRARRPGKLRAQFAREFIVRRQSLKPCRPLWRPLRGFVFEGMNLWKRNYSQFRLVSSAAAGLRVAERGVSLELSRLLSEIFDVPGILVNWTVGSSNLTWIHDSLNDGIKLKWASSISFFCLLFFSFCHFVYMGLNKIRIKIRSIKFLAFSYYY